MNEKYKLVGFMNMLNVRPGFIYPIFKLNDILYFQHGEKDRLIRFVEVNKCLYKDLIPLDNSNIEIDLQSNPIYAYQRRNKSIYYGNANEMKKYLQKIRTESNSLKKEIEFFIREIDEKNKNNIIHEATEKKIYGDRCTRAGRFDEAMEAYCEATKLCKEVNDKNKWAEVMKAVGDLLAKVRQYDAAVDAYYMAEEIYKQEEKIYEQAGVYKAIGDLLRKTGKIREAREQYKKAECLYIKTVNQYRLKPDETAMAVMLKDIGDLYGDLQEYDNAIKCYLSAEKIYEKVHDEYGRAKVQIAKNKIVRKTEHDSAGVDKKYIIRGKTLEIDEIDFIKLAKGQRESDIIPKDLKIDSAELLEVIENCFSFGEKEYGQKRSGQKEDKDNKSKKDNRVIALMDC